MPAAPKIALLVAAVTLGSCRCVEPSPAGESDAGVGDAGSGDAGVADAGAMDESKYLLILDQLYAELSAAIEAAQKRRFCTRDELTIARHGLTPAGFTGMQRILDEAGVTGPEVEAYVLSRGFIGPSEEAHAARHAEAIAALERAAEASIEAAGDDCVSDAPRCEKAFAAFCDYHLAGLLEPARGIENKELFRGMAGFLNACRSGKGAADFDCLLDAPDRERMSRCALANGHRLEWVR